MKLREDVKYLTRLVKNSALTIKEAKEFAALNLMIVPVETVTEDYLNYCLDMVNKTVSPDNKIMKRMVFPEYFPLYEMMVYVGNSENWDIHYSAIVDGVKVSPQPNLYAKIKVIDPVTIKIGMTIDFKYWVEMVAKVSADGKLNYVDDGTFTAKGKGVTGKAGEWNKYNKIMEYLKKMYPTMLIVTFSNWVQYNEQLDNYAISTTINSKVEYKKSIIHNEDQINKSVGSRIIYLNALPKVNDVPEITGTTNRTVAAHQRRGTWVTLRAERYKNHPLYQIEKAIYRKPAWIGDRTRIVHGATYTVIDKQVNFEE